MISVELFVLDTNTWNHLIESKKVHWHVYNVS